MIEDLDDKGIKTILVTQPFVLSSSNRWQDAVDNKVLAKNDDGEPYRFDFYFGNTGLIDVFDENAREWFWDKYVNIFDDGVAGTWGDLGEPEVHPDDIIHYLSETQSTARGEEVHNAFGHQLAGVLSGDIHDFIIKEGKATIEVELAPLESEVIRFRTRW